MAIVTVLKTAGYYGLKYGAPIAGVFGGVAYRETLARGIEKALPFSSLDTFVSSLERKATIPAKNLSEKIQSEKLSNLEQALTTLKILGNSSDDALIAMEDLDAKKLGQRFREQREQREKLQSKLTGLATKIGDISPETHAYKFKEASGIKETSRKIFHLPEKNVEVYSESENFIKQINNCMNEKFKELKNDSLKKEFEETINNHIQTFQKEENLKVEELKKLKGEKNSQKTKEDTLQEMNKNLTSLKTNILNSIETSISTHKDVETRFKEAEGELMQLSSIVAEEEKSVSSKDLKDALDNANFASLKPEIEKTLKDMDIKIENAQDLTELKKMRNHCTQGKKLTGWISWFTSYIPYNEKILNKVDGSFSYMSGACNYNTVENKLSQWGGLLMDKVKSVGSSIWSKLSSKKSESLG